MYQAIFIDIDGTLRTDAHILTPRTKDAVQKAIAAGIKIILCTGRVRGYALNVAKECGIENGFIITSSGAEIFDLDKNKAVHSCRMTPETCENLAAIARRHDIRFNFNANGLRYVDQLYRKDGLEILLDCSVSELAQKQVIVQALLRSTDFNTMKLIRPDLENVAGARVINAAKSLNDPNRPPEEKVHYDIVSDEASKGSAIKKLCSELGIPLADTVGIGDDYNDLEMFDVVGLTAVMNNAGEMIQKMGDVVLESNNDDGVAKFLEALNGTNFAKIKTVQKQDFIKQ